MAQFFAIHSDNPQVRLIQQAADVIRQGGVVVLPTDSGYALGCALENKRGVDVIRQIRRLDDKHNFTLLCRDLSEISLYARVENQEYRLLKAHTPGAYTFILEATR
ncbi:MAG: Sua5/YciO/YrdC/YwlC family protein, partial [Litoricola sp.]|nr:Sua5/YciO/YrdC/YwlC family protein [Litorivicinus sp.]